MSREIELSKDMFTKLELEALNTRRFGASTSRMRALRNAIPVVEVHHRQQILECGHWTAVFDFTMPEDFQSPIGERNIRILGAKDAQYGDEKLFEQTYHQVFRARGNNLVQPYVVIDTLKMYDGYLEGLDRRSIKIYEAIMGMSINERRGLIHSIRGYLLSNKEKILQAAGIFGVLNTLNDASTRISWARYDALGDL